MLLFQYTCIHKHEMVAGLQTHAIKRVVSRCFIHISQRIVSLFNCASQGEKAV